VTQAIRTDYQQSGAAGVCKPILLALPAWFGIESANQHYLEYVDANPTFIAYNGDTATGFLSLAQPFPQSAEIYVMAVHPEHHRQGVGRALVAAAEAHLRQQDARFLQVKTLNDTHPSPEYALTRQFYLSMGFVPLEVFPELWGEQNPCLQLIKAL